MGWFGKYIFFSLKKRSCDLINNQLSPFSSCSFILFRVQSNNDRFSIRASVENRSVTLKTQRMHCTASLGSSPHLFIRINERRVHFDGINFVVRNMGHSSSFDGGDNLRIH